MYDGGKTRKTITRRMRIAAFSGSLYSDKEKGLPHLESCACVSFFLYLLTYTGWFLDEAFMYSNC